MLAISILSGWFMTIYFMEKDNIDRQTASTVLILSVLGALLGARILFFITNPGSFNSLNDFFAANQGGLVAYGGFIGGVGVAAYYCRSRRLSLLRVADHASPALALGTAITRIGCYLSGCCYGAVSSASWAVMYPEGSPAYNHHLRENLIEAGASRSMAVYPTQLFEIGYALLIFAVLMLVRRIKNRFHGMLFFIFLSLYGIFRFTNEFFRDDTQRGSVGPLSTSQFISILVVIAIIAGSVHLYKNAARSRSEEAAADPDADHSTGKKRRAGKKGRRKSSAKKKK